MKSGGGFGRYAVAVPTAPLFIPRRRARVLYYNRAVSVKSSKTASLFEGGGRGQEGEWGELALTEKKAVGVKLSDQPSPPMGV